MTTGFSREPRDARSFASGADLVMIVTAIAAVVGGVIAPCFSRNIGYT
ncbi:hypothetical protein [Burkholderia mayonis]|nr:hypothetical protein [Burkholderia mayonis]